MEVGDRMKALDHLPGIEGQCHHLSVLSPALFFRLCLAPIPVSFFYSLFKWDGIGQRSFIGLRTEELIGNPYFGKHSEQCLLVVISSPFNCPGIALALLLTSRFRWTKLLKKSMSCPTMSAVAIGMLWVTSTNFFGLLNMFLEAIGRYD